MKVSKKETKKKTTYINMPKEDIKVEKRQPTFLPTLKKIVKRNEFALSTDSGHHFSQFLWALYNFEMNSFPCWVM